MTDKELRDAVIAGCRELVQLGLPSAHPAMSACAGMNSGFSLVLPECRMAPLNPTIFRSWRLTGGGLADVVRRANGGFIATYSGPGMRSPR